MNKKGSSITRVLDIIEAISTAKHPPTPLDLSIELDIPKLNRTGFVGESIF